MRKGIHSAGHQASGANALNGEGGRETSKPVAGRSGGLMDDLGAYRQQIVKAALLRDPAAVPDVLHYALCMQLLSGERGLGADPAKCPLHCGGIQDKTRGYRAGQGVR